MNVRLNHYRSSLVAALFLIAGFATPVFAQSGTAAVSASENRSYSSYLGGYVGGNVLLHNAQFNAVSGCPTCNPAIFGTQLGFGGSAGLLFESSFAEDALRFQARLSAAYWQSLFSTDERQPITVGGVDFPNAIIRRTLSSSMLSVGIEPALSIKIVNGLRAELGAAVALPLVSAFEQREFSPDGIRFRRPDGSLSATIFEQRGTLGSISNIQAAALAGLSYSIPIGEGSFIAPFGRFFFPLTNFSLTELTKPASSNGATAAQRESGSGSWRAMTVQIGAAFVFGLRQSTPTDTKYERDTTIVMTDGNDDVVRLVSSESRTEIVSEYGLENVERTIIREKYVHDVPKRNALKLELKVIGIGKDGDEQTDPTVLIEEFESEQYQPLLPYIFFPESKDSLKLTRQNLLPNPRAADRWNEQDVENDAITVFSNLLNVLGSRMKKDPTSSIILTGCNANMGTEAGDTVLSRRRANNVARYLTRIWDISPERITIRAQNLPSRPARTDTQDGQEENRRVEIDANPAALLAPVVDGNVTLDITPPTLEMTPIIEAPAGLNWWYMYIKQRSTLLKQFSGAEPKTQSWIINTSLLAPGQDLPLAVTLQAADQTGKQGTVSKDVTVKQITVKKKRQELLDDKRIDRFSFITFDYDKSVVEADLTKKLLEQVKTKVAPSSTVTIAGYGDRSGTLAYNQDLAKRRCLEVQKILQIPEEQLRLKPIGNKVLIQDNNVPEGRAYSRIVQITIETPIKPGTPPAQKKQRKK